MRLSRPDRRGISRGEDNTLALLWQGLLDTNREVRQACAQSLAQIDRRQSALRPLIEKKLIEAIDDPGFEVLDKFKMYPAYDTAYERLWLLVTGSNQSE